jgi:hypothetical protein
MTPDCSGALWQVAVGCWSQASGRCAKALLGRLALDFPFAADCKLLLPRVLPDGNW